MRRGKTLVFARHPDHKSCANSFYQEYGEASKRPSFGEKGVTFFFSGAFVVRELEEGCWGSVASARTDTWHRRDPSGLELLEVQA